MSVISATYGRNSVTVCVSKKKISPSVCIMDITTKIKSMLVVVQFFYWFLYRKEFLLQMQFLSKPLLTLPSLCLCLCLSVCVCLSSVSFSVSVYFFVFIFVSVCPSPKPLIGITDNVIIWLM